MQEKTININNQELTAYAKTLSRLLNENAACEIERNLRKLLSQLSDGTANKETIDRLKNACLNSYFNGATDIEMKYFAQINAGRFFSDSAFTIISKITAMPQAESVPVLRQYLADRNQFVRQAEESLRKLSEKGVIRR